jgi:hypothetical protein
MPKHLELHYRRYARPVLALVVVLGIGVWAMSNRARTLELGAFLDYEQHPADLAELLETSEQPARVPPAAEAMVLVAGFYGEIFFPPDDIKAAKWAANALQVRPLESGLWVVLARHLFFAGQVDQARVALERADELDPNYPRQRLAAIRLWTLMGEKDRAGALASQIGRLGFRERGEAAAELIRAGWTRAEIFKQLDGPILSDPEIVELLNLLRTTRPEEARGLVEAIPTPRLAVSKTLRSTASRHAVDAVLLDQVERIWHLERPESPTFPRFPADFSNLMLAFEAPPLAMGWQGPPSENWVLLRPRQIDQPGALGAPPTSIWGLEVQYRDTPDESRRVSRWTFYRVPLVAGEQLEVAMRCRTYPSDRSAAKIIATDGRQRIESNTTELRTDLVQTLSLTFPPRDEDRMITLQLERTRARSIFDTEAELFVHSLDLVSQPAPEETQQ